MHPPAANHRRAGILQIHRRKRNPSARARACREDFCPCAVHVGGGGFHLLRFTG
jgi:hypothetical protein